MRREKTMSANVRKLLVGMMIVCLLLSPALALADTPGGTGPDDALAPSGEWTPLTKGERHWYAFEYQGHQEMQKVEDEEDEEEAIWVSSSIQILLDSEPDNGVAFSVWTPENIRLWALGEEVEPVGRGGEDEYAPGDLCWCGTFEEPGTYYVVVEHTGQGPETSYYTLDIRGSDVSFTAPMAMPAKADEPAAGEEGLATAEPETGAGAGPDNALAPTDEWVSITGGDALWYAFQYQGHHVFEENEDDEEVAIWVASPVEIWLDAEPDQAVVFSIWNEDQVRAWAQGEEIEPVGRGTENENEAGDLFWAGSLGNPGRYYVVVENQGAEPGTFMLSISGEDVSP
jgi:hypothetical protein